ncbi:MAG TPA: energy transducer TonB [Vicinamibacterales bacterium]|jgi:protein TonB|nr:energy transducer TonB [Vicinamibacterales bacterium]
MPHRRALAFLSLLIHGIALSIIIVAQLFAVGTLPTPRRPLIFDDPRIVHLVDITLPATPPHVRRSGNDSTPAMTSPANAAPITAPNGVAPETGKEGATPAPEVLSIEHSGGGGLDVVGRVERPAPPPPTPAPVRLRSGMQPPAKVLNVAPVYPNLARAAHVEGVVILEAVIDAHGRVDSVRVLRSIPTLDQAAVDAVRQWRFTPTLLNGEPVPIVMTVTVNFTLKP